MLRVIIHLPNGTNQTFEFTSWRTVIGRSRSCDLTLVSSQVSKSHAAIEVVEGVISIRDLGSRNGINVNGIPINRQKELKADDLILLGDVELTIDPQSQIFENTPSRPLIDLIFEEKFISEHSQVSPIISTSDTLIGQPHQSVTGGPPILRVLRITEDYIPRTVFRISPFTFKLSLDELCWIRPTLDLQEVAVENLQNVTHFTFDEREDNVSNPGTAILLRSYYRLPNMLEILNFRETSQSSDGLRVFSERSTFEPFEFLFS